MKNFYLFLLLMTSLSINAQSNCEDANSYVVSAYSHIKDSYDSNNITHLKYYANRSLESYKLSKEKFANCNCQTALNLVDKSIELLEKVESAKTFEDGRFYVNRARDTSKECNIAIDKCTFENSATKSINTELSDLENEQLKLQQQQDALKLKAEQIQLKLAKQKEEALTLKKKQLIISYKAAISSNIKSYNEALSVCDGNNNLLKSTVDYSRDLTVENMDNIHLYYKNTLKGLASDYLEQLNSSGNNN